jgi:hypothetical protein
MIIIIGIYVESKHWPQLVCCGGFVNFSQCWMPCKQERKQIEKNIADAGTSNASK